jgi:hypothetical protein
MTLPHKARLIEWKTLNGREAESGLAPVDAVHTRHLDVG